MEGLDSMATKFRKMLRLIAISVTLVLVLSVTTSSQAEDNPVLLKYKKILEAEPSNIEVRYLLGSAQLKTGDYEEGVKNLITVYELRKDDATLAFRIGFAYHNLGRFEEANLYYKSAKGAALEKETLTEEFKEELSTSFFNLAVEYQESKDYARAIENYEESIHLFQDDATSICMIGLAHYKNLEFDKSRDNFNRCLEKAPENKWANDYIVSIYEAEGIEYIKKGDYKNASDIFDVMLNIKPNYEKAKYYQCFIRYSKGDIYEAKTCIEEMTDIKDEDVGQGVGVMLFNVGVMMQDYEDWLGSIEALKKSITFIVPSEEIYLYISKAYLESGSSDEAIWWFNETLNIAPDSKDAEIGLGIATEKAVIIHINKSKTYLRERRLDSALEEVSAALLLEPRNNKALSVKKIVEAAIIETVNETDSAGAVKQFILLASNALKDKKYNKSLKNYHMALNLDKDSDEANKGMEEAKAKKADKVEKESKLAKEAHKRGSYYKASRHLRRLLKIEPSHKEAKERLKESNKALSKITSPMVKTAKTHLSSSNVEAAFAEFKKILTIDPSNVTANNYLSKIDNLKAKKALENKVNILYLKGIELYTKGKYKEAVVAWQEVLALNPQHEKAILNIQKTRKILKPRRAAS